MGPRRADPQATAAPLPMEGRGLALWWLPPAPAAAAAQARIQALAQRLGSPAFPAHVTLLSALPPGHATDADAVLATVAAAVPAPLLRAGPLTTAAAWSRCLAVELEAPAATHAGREAAAAALGLPPPGPFRPHLSLAYARLPEDTRRGLVADTAPGLPDFRPDALALVDTRGPIGGWRVLADLSLRPKEPASFL